jgi:hypothetical protein
MRGLLAGLLVALIISTVALLVATIGAVGVAAIGLLLTRWFDLSQWQGTLIALAVTMGLGYLVYKLASQVPAAQPWTDDWDEEEDDEEEVAEVEAPPIVPWRRNRPTQGELPPEKPAPKPASGTRKTK